MKSTDLQYMRRALSLAALGKGRVSPNPCVGCVIVKHGHVVGEGYHEAFGGPHAEVIALSQAGGRAHGGTMYVTLEPCSHWGKTPPCAPEVARAGLRRVVAAMPDPNPRVRGRGIAYLRKAGVRIDTGVEQAAAERLNRPFITYITKRRPHVVLKAAMSLDGKIATATGDSKWISSEMSRRLAHKLRADTDAILVGANTARRDNPQLTSHGLGRDPLRVIIDPTLRLPASLRVFQNGRKTVVIAGRRAPRGPEGRLARKGVEVIRVAETRAGLDLKAALEALAARNVGQMIVEGGGETAWRFLKAGLVDEAMFFVAPRFVGGRDAVTPLGGEGFRQISGAARLEWQSASRVGDDVLLHAFVKPSRGGR